jgi:hypothetical protein
MRRTTFAIIATFLCSASISAVLRTLAEKTGGSFYRADDLRHVAPAFEAITTELGVQYSLSYYSNSRANSGGRQIKVRVRLPNLVVRTRDSYSAGTIARKN